MRHVGVVAALLVTIAGRVAGQTGGAIAGRVRDAVSGLAIGAATIAVDGGRQGAATDTGGFFRVREVRSGWHRVQVARIGYRPTVFDSVLVRSGETVTLNVTLETLALQVESIAVTATPDRVLDPMVPQDLQRVTAEEMHRLPVTTVEEAVALSAGAVGESYRGGRLGEQAFVLDGIGVKNQLDASTGSLGIRIPPDVLTEASLVTNGFSARYGQAISGLVNVVTKDGGERWEGRAAYETDRPLPNGWDYGIDRLVVSGSGPLHRGIGFAGVLDLQGRLDADPVNAPPPTDPRDPRAQNPSLLPHNGGERYDGALKLTVPFGARQTLRLFGLQSVEQRLLFDPAYKYDPSLAPAQRVRGTLLTGQLQHTSGPGSLNPLTIDLRVGYFDRVFQRGALSDHPTQRLGAFTFETFHFLGEDLARRQDTVAARGAVPGFDPPDWSERTPWGVPAFFLGTGPRGDIVWNRFRELRTQVDVTLGSGRDADFYLGGEVAGQRVQTFQRVLAYLPVDSTLPGPVASDFRPLSAAAYAETQLRVEDLAFTMGLRYEQFDGRVPVSLGSRRFGAQRSLNPRLAVSTVLHGATFVASYGRFSQAPDFQYLVDAAFDDTTRTGRFRRGNPGARLRGRDTVRVQPRGCARRRCTAVAWEPLRQTAGRPGGVGAAGARSGLLDLRERGLRHCEGDRADLRKGARAWLGAAARLHLPDRHRDRHERVPAAAAHPPRFAGRHDQPGAARVPARLRPAPQPHGRGPGAGRADGVKILGGLEAAAIFQFGSGLPYSRTNTAGDTLLGLPNDARLPSEYSLDALLRRPVRLRGLRGGVYIDARNLLNRRNTVAVRRDTGEPGVTGATLQGMRASGVSGPPRADPLRVAPLPPVGRPRRQRADRGTGRADAAVSRGGA